MKSNTQYILQQQINKPSNMSKSISNYSRRNDKYSLRQRQKWRNARTLIDESTSMDISGDHSSELEIQMPKVIAIPSKSKTKAAPLSKYRRKTANARERTRMREINSAFENLRHCVPQAITGDDPSTGNEKLTKITTLRLAMKYITMLSESLTKPCVNTDFLIECLSDSAARHAHQAIRIQETSITTHQVASSKKMKSKSIQKNTCPNKLTKNNSKQKFKKQKSVQQFHGNKSACTAETIIESSYIQSPESAYCSSNSSVASPSSAYNTQKRSSEIDFMVVSSNDTSTYENSINPIQLTQNSVSEINTMILESDGESQQLSDHCLSPLIETNLLDNTSSNQMKFYAPITREFFHGDIAISRSMEQTDVELSLRLLNSTNSNVFDYDEDQRPSACISPLATLDSLSTFSDLLHTDFSEQSALDLLLT